MDMLDLEELEPSESLLVTYENKIICKKCYELKRDEFKELIKTEKRTTIQTSMKDNEEYIRIMQQLQTRDISSNDYDTLLRLDEHRNRCSNRDVTKCKYCEITGDRIEESKISEYQFIMPCLHCFHKYVPRDIGDKKSSTNEPKMSRDVQNVYNRKLEESKGLSFGLVGTGLYQNENDQPEEIDSRTLFTSQKRGVNHSVERVTNIHKRIQKGSNSVKPRKGENYNSNADFKEII